MHFESFIKAPIFEFTLPIPEQKFEEEQEYSGEVQKDIEKGLKQFPSQVKIEARPICLGRGADFPMVLLTISGVIILGKKINEGLEGWINIFKKIVFLFKKLKKKYGISGVSLGVGIGLCLEKLEKEGEDISKFNIEYAHDIPLSPQILGGNEFQHNDERFYLIVFKKNNEKAYIFLIKATGEIIVQHKLNLSNWLAYRGIKE